MKRLNNLSLIVAVTLGVMPGSLYAEVVLQDADLQDVAHSVSYTQRTAVHDPSVVVDTLTDPQRETFYIFGSHMGVSKSTDLVHWASNVCGGESLTATLFGKRNADGSVAACPYTEAFKSNEVKSVTALVNGTPTEVTFGDYDAAAWNTALDGFTVAGNMWAPDVVYNPTMGKWLLYMSLNGSKWNSAIVCMAADRVTGPYVYQGPVIFSGFDVTTGSPSYTASDMALVLGEQSALPARYARGTNWGTYWPHAIDPCVFYDAEGGLWMSYGSWSGGIYVLKLDTKTGLRDYTVTYPATANNTASVTSDPYFGTKIAGGYYVSGEGSYISRIGDYYYLFMSYGFYSPDGGYEMRIFRSARPDGPYVDCSNASGVSAIYTSYLMNYGMGAATNRGMKLMGSYQWDAMPVAELAQGHNSATTDRQGRSLLVYHTKFNDGTAGHAVRVHQLFTNEDGWICAAPYEFAGETPTQDSIASRELYGTDEIAGTYQLLRHTYKMDYANYAYNTTDDIVLHADGSVSGAMTGSWSVTPGTAFATVTLGGVAYKGVLTRQTIDYTDVPALCFTAVSSSSGAVGSTRALQIWGSNANPKAAIAYNALRLTVPFADGDVLYTDVMLPSKGLLGATVVWTTSDASVLTADGKIHATAMPQAVTLTATISKDGYTYCRNFALTVARPTGDCVTGLAAYYDFEGNLQNVCNRVQAGTAMAETSGTKPALEQNAALGSKVLHQYFGYPSASSSSYTKFVNPLQGAELADGATVSMFVQRTVDNDWDAIWSFLDTDESDGVSGRCYMTANVYLGYNGTGGWFDANYPSTNIDDLGTGAWHLLTLTAVADGWSIYIDGKKAYDQDSYVTFNSGGGFSSYASILALMASASDFYLGYGSWWGSAPLLLDDLTFFRRALTADDVMALYVAQCQGSFASMTSLSQICGDAPADNTSAIFDLMGRRVVSPTGGFYLRAGKKFLQK